MIPTAGTTMLCLRISHAPLENTAHPPTNLPSVDASFGKNETRVVTVTNVLQPPHREKLCLPLAKTCWTVRTGQKNPNEFLTQDYRLAR